MPSDEGQTPNPQDTDPSLEVEHQADEKPVDFESESHQGTDDEPIGSTSDEDQAGEESQDESSDEGIEDQDDVEGTCVGREGDSHDPFEFSESAGAATL